MKLETGNMRQVTQQKGHLNAVCFMFHDSTRGFRRENRGFTLVELLVSISIFVIVTTVVLINQGSFNNSIFLNNVAYDTALVFRQAQSYGVNVRVANEASLGESGATVPYGVFVSDATAQERVVIVLFADLDRNGSYNFSPLSTSCSGECINQYILKRGVRVSDICVTVGGAETCSPTTQTRAHITFVRPDPDAQIKVPGVVLPISKVGVTLLSQQGRTRSVAVYASGQIAVE